ncbi:ribonuclease P protein component [Thiolapillus sp.]|uniref:ribonuclease P protein component n=1 Tax=Thiolapillus sp. TaxID=2017437 RepID=UPI0025D320A1|nr:ribonuclease P protein component [Thiolapillus sp.]
MSKQGFPRHVRLLSAEDYKKVFAQPVRSSDRYFTVLARYDRQQELARLGLAVAKKHVRRAVDRNRIKRLLRESFRRHQQYLKGYDLVVLVKPGIHKADNLTLFSSLEKHWKRLNQAVPSD